MSKQDRPKCRWIVGGSESLKSRGPRFSASSSLLPWSIRCSTEAKPDLTNTRQVQQWHSRSRRHRGRGVLRQFLNVILPQIEEIHILEHAYIISWKCPARKTILKRNIVGYAYNWWIRFADHVRVKIFKHIFRGAWLERSWRLISYW